MIKNLLFETKATIKESGHTRGDIVCIGAIDATYCCTWDEYKILANNEYNTESRSMIVDGKLVIIFADSGEMWRNRYDGAEWWMYSKPFATPESCKPAKVEDIFNVGRW